MSGQVLVCRARNIFHIDIPTTTALAILFIWTASFADYFLTVFQISRGYLELNPILAPFFHSLQYEKALLVKTSLTFPGICILSACCRHPVAMKAISAILVVYVCLLVYHGINILL